MTGKIPWWPVAVIGVLAVTVGANGYLLYQANRGVAAIETDYYRKAVDWDSTLAQSRRNVALGWQLTAALDTAGTLEARLVDSAGAAITGAAVTVEGFPIAFEDGTFAAGLDQAAGGYRAKIRLRHGGLHELRFAAKRGGDRFTHTVRGLPGGPFTSVR